MSFQTSAPTSNSTVPPAQKTIALQILKGTQQTKKVLYLLIRCIIVRRRYYPPKPPAPKKLAISSLEERMVKGWVELNKPPPSSKK
jgi:hypothetical protein